MILTQTFRARQPKSLLDELNKESGRIYTLTMLEHWRVKRKKDIWLSHYGAMRINDSLSGFTILTAHSRDAAQDGFYEACKTTKALKKVGIEAKYPYHRKKYRSTVWKKDSVRVKNGKMFLPKSRGMKPVVVPLPKHLQGLEFLEVRLVFDFKHGKYDWHVVCDDKIEPSKSTGSEVVAVDLGEIHPAAACTEKEAVVFSARELRSIIQGHNKSKAELTEKQSRCKKYSLRWKKLQRAKNKKAGKFKLKQRDICHKVSKAVVDFAEEHNANTIVIGDIRDAADEVSLGKVSNQKISQWPHGILQKYIEYKAKRKGIETKLQNEAYTSQTCPSCGNRKKPRGRVYKCSKCGWQGSRDGQVGAANILSLAKYGELSRVLIPETKYRYPYLVRDEGKRSYADTIQVVCKDELQKAAGF